MAQLRQYFLGISPFLSGAEAGVCTFEDSITASSTLAILLLFGFIAGILDTFGSSGSCGGLRVFDCSADFLNSGYSAIFSLASALRPSQISPVMLLPSILALWSILPWLQQERGSLAQQQKKALQQASALWLFQYTWAIALKL
jgi:hypothetical protein